MKVRYCAPVLKIVSATPRSRLLLVTSGSDLIMYGSRSYIQKLQEGDEETFAPTDDYYQYYIN